MSLTDSIAAFSTARSQAELQVAVATRVLKISNDTQGQVAAELLGEALENAEQAIIDFAGGLEAQLDAYA